MKRAGRRLSGIAYARQKEEKYVAVLRVKWWVFLIFLLILIIGLMLAAYSPGAIVKPSQNRPYVIEPDETNGEDETYAWSNLYITVPGYKECVIDNGNRTFQVYNPESNRCLMEYIVTIQGNEVAKSGRLEPGEVTQLDFYDRLVNGKYTMDIVTKAYAMKENISFNSVKQTVDLTVSKGADDNE